MHKQTTLKLKDLKDEEKSQKVLTVTCRLPSNWCDLSLEQNTAEL